jgi:hypothetical protein
MASMAHCWLVCELAGARRVFVANARGSLDARIRAAMAGLIQVVIGVRQLDAKEAGRIAGKDRGRVLSAAEAAQILGLSSRR